MIAPTLCCGAPYHLCPITVFLFVGGDKFIMYSYARAGNLGYQYLLARKSFSSSHLISAYVSTCALKKYNTERDFSLASVMVASFPFAAARSASSSKESPPNPPPWDLITSTCCVHPSLYLARDVLFI